ncbi:hypothetical protein [Thermomonas brevis]
MKSLLCALLLAASSAAVATGPAKPTDNPELAQLFQQDQADRSTTDIDWNAVTQRDQARRERVKALLDAGAVRSAADHYHAAMVFQHGDSLADFRLANALATLAMAQAPDDAHYRWLVGASWDRLLMRQLQPQWYGTQFKGDSKGMYLYPVAADAVSDDERKAMVGHTLAEEIAHVPEAAKQMGLPVRAKAPTLDELRRESASSEVP